MKDRSHDDAMAELFREDPAFATEYLNSVLEDGEQADLLVALRQMAKAFGGYPPLPNARSSIRRSFTERYRPKAIPSYKACRQSSRRWGCAWPLSHWSMRR